MYNINLEKSINDIFIDIIKKHHFVLESVNENQVLLIKDNFAISVNISFEGADITYITKDNNGNYIEYWFVFYISNQFDEVDRSIINMPNNNAEKIIAEIKIISSGLNRHWGNVLQGDKSWIDDYLKTDSDDNLPPHESKIQILKKYF